jgi:uncharacterized protein
MQTSPFTYQGPLRPDEVRGRDALLADLTERVTEHRVTALLGPRRYGKTSVLHRLARDLTEVSTVTVDLFGVQTHGDLVVRLAGAMQDAVPAVRDSAYDLSLSVGVDLAGVSAQLQLSPRKRPDPRVLYSQLVRVLADIGQRTPLVVIFDEFQSIAGVEGATAVLRTELQHHYQTIGLVFAGSAPSAMRDIFTRHDQPFFNQADLVEIPPLDAAAVHLIVGEGFRATGRDPGGVAGHIFGLTGGHPQRTMRAADEVWRHTGPRDVADARWGAALVSLRDAEAATLAASYDELTADEKKVLRIYASGGAIFGSAAERLELSSGGAQHARERLLAEGKLSADPAGGDIFVTDPLLADWLRRRLPT